MSKQTAVEWLVDAIFNEVDLKDAILKLAIQQAKEKEKEQIMRAHSVGSSPSIRSANSSIYYNENYGQ
jgi:hypothetical protein